MCTAIVIPARLAATRLDQKLLADLGGKPLIVQTMLQAQKCKSADRVVVATDSPEIAEAVTQSGGDAIMTRSTHVCGTDRVAEVAEHLDAEWLINLQGDEPFVDPRDLDMLFIKLKHSGADIATLRAPITDVKQWRDPSVVKVVARDDGMALYFSRAPIPHDRHDQDNLEVAFRHIGVYGYQRTALLRLAQTPAHPLEKLEGLEQLRALAIGLSMAVCEGRTRARGIDTQQDLTWARAHVAELGSGAFPKG